MDISDSIWARWIVLGLAYNRHKTWYKWPFGKDPDRSWCQRHISVKLSWSQPMEVSDSHSYAATDVHGAMGCDRKSFTLVCGDTNTCPGPFLTVTCPEFHIKARSKTFHLACIYDVTEIGICGGRVYNTFQQKLNGRWVWCELQNRYNQVCEYINLRNCCHVRTMTNVETQAFGPESML